jgi:hypothetical protein
MIQRRTCRGHVLVYCDAHDLHVREHLVPRAAALHEVQAQARDRAGRIGQVDHLGPRAEALAQVREEQDLDLHQYSSE